MVLTMYFFMLWKKDNTPEKKSFRALKNEKLIFLVILL